MKKLNTIYYLLFVLLIMGAFASMAQNDYGMIILGLVAFTFSLLFVVQLFTLFGHSEIPDLWNVFELCGLLLLSIIMCLRVFHIRFPLVEWLFGIAGALLIVVYSKQLIKTNSTLLGENRGLAWGILAFHLSLVFYTVSMVTVPFIPLLAEPTGAAAFVLLLGFLIMGFLKKDLMLAGEKVSAFTLASRFKNRSVILMSLYFLFTLYMGLTRIEVIPKLYSNEFPKSYFQLVEQAETGKEVPRNGKYKHEEFKDRYDAFTDRYSPK